ncbi:MAG: hypothetical protein ACTSWW_13045 [Promethearchaeota archaeon]
MSHGKRYTAKERKEIMNFLASHTYEETMKEYSVSQMSLARWVKRKNRAAIQVESPIKVENIPDIQHFLYMLELMEEISTAYVASTTGMLFTSSSSPSNENAKGIFKDQSRIMPLIGLMLSNTQNITQKLIQNLSNDRASTEIGPLFTEILLNTVIGVVYLVELGPSAVSLIIFDKSCSPQEIFSTHHRYIEQILTRIRKLVE